MTPRARVLALAASLAAAGLLATAGTTLAAGPVSTLDPSKVHTVTLGAASEAVLPLQVDRLFPGAATHARFVLRRGAGFAGGTYAVGLANVRDMERGCNHPEITSGDTTCGDGVGQGELSEQLLVGQSWTASVADCATALPPTTGTPMGGGGALSLAPPPLSVADDVCVVIGLILPRSADNLVQTDLVRFDLRLGLQLPTLVPETAATSATPTPAPLQGETDQPAHGATSAPTPTATPTAAVPSPAPGGPLSASSAGTISTQPRTLPFTGGQPLALLAWGALALALGWALLHAARGSRA